MNEHELAAELGVYPRTPFWACIRAVAPGQPVGGVYHLWELPRVQAVNAPGPHFRMRCGSYVMPLPLWRLELAPEGPVPPAPCCGACHAHQRMGTPGPYGVAP